MDLEARVAALEARLQTAEDVQAIHRLKARYGALADARYEGGRPAPAARLRELGEQLAALFSEDGVWDGGPRLGRCVGRDAIAERLATPTLAFAWHFFVKPEITVEGDEAHGRWDVLAPCTGTDGRAYWMSGVEDDRYRRVDGVWLHTHMRLSVVFLCPYEQGWAEAMARRET